MKKYLILLIFILAFTSCKKSDNSDYVLQVDGYIENYVVIVNDDSFICIKYDNREIDKQKLLDILNISVNVELNLSDSLKEQVADELEKYKEDNNSLLDTLVENKNKVEANVIDLINNNLRVDLTPFFDRIGNQSVYYFDDIETIRDSANYLAQWLEQVKALSTRKDL